MSPELGVLDEDAFDDLLADDADEALALLADLATATDARLRVLARALAARVSLDLAARSGRDRAGSPRRLRTARMPESGADLDLDASLEAVAAARAGARPPDPAELRAQVWGRHRRALCLLVDRSGSMRGAGLATAALAAAAVTHRAPDDHSILAFNDEVIVLKAQDAAPDAERVVDALLTLRGHGTTDLTAAFDAARAQLERSTAGDRLVVVLSDCRATAGADPTAAAHRLAELADVAVMAPDDDADDARALAASFGARFTSVKGPSSLPAAFASLLDSAAPPPHGPRPHVTTTAETAALPVTGKRVTGR